MNSSKYIYTTITLIVSSIGGTAIGVMNTIIVNFTLLEISTNSDFALYFGVFYITFGSILLWRSLTPQDQTYGESIIFLHPRPLAFKTNMKDTIFIILSILIIVSGLTSFILDQSWFININKFYKIPIYCLLGVAICMSFIIIMINIINFIHSLINGEGNQKPIIYGANQYRYLIAFYCIVGILYGVVFGVMDIHSNNSSFSQTNFIKEQNYCFPIGIGFGCISGYINEYIRSEDHSDYQHVCNEDEEV